MDAPEPYLDNYETCYRSSPTTAVDTRIDHSGISWKAAKHLSTGIPLRPEREVSPSMNFQANQYASIFSTKLSSAYNQLRGDLGAPQTATDTIQKLVERIQTSPEVEDRRTAVLGLKGLSRDWKEVS
jgi:hypothetical protein